MKILFSSDALTPPSDVDAVCITTNLQTRKDGSAVMGAGIALAANKKWRLDQALGELIRAGNTGVAEIFAVRRGTAPALSIVAFPTKIDWRNRSSMVLIQRGMDQLKELAAKNNWQHVWLPSLGTNNGGLRREDVWPSMAKTLDDRFTLVLRERDPR